MQSKRHNDMILCVMLQTSVTTQKEERFFFQLSNGFITGTATTHSEIIINKLTATCTSKYLFCEFQLLKWIYIYEVSLFFSVLFQYVIVSL